jgi:hypothetical protein
MTDILTIANRRNSFPWAKLSLSLVRELPLGEKIAWLLFCLTCLQSAFLIPNFAVIEGDRAKLLTALLCAGTLLASVLLVKRATGSGNVCEVVISTILTALVLVSGILSETPEASLLRGFSMAASGLGGFWCARMLLNSSGRRAFFTWFCTAVLGAMIVLSLLGYLLSGSPDRFLDVNPHPLASRMLLLAFAPLALVLGGVKRNAVVGASMLCLGYGVCFITNLRSAVLIPILLGAVSVACGSLNARRFMVVLIPLAAALLLFFHQLPESKMRADNEPTYYRVENYPFSWHIAVRNPLFGNGLRAPRENYLENYELVYPYSTKENFADSTRRIVVSENVFLTFMADLGFPFLIIYMGSVIVLLVRLIRSASKPNEPGFLPPLAILLPLVGALINFLVLDGLLHAHVSWFFHILLGMIPRPGARVAPDS